GPELAVRAVGLVAERHPLVRLVFMGATPPNRGLREHAAAARARTAADDLGLTDRVVFFRPGWVPYARRGETLAEADHGISGHHDTAETRYGWRTRLLYYLWAGLPVVGTGGDALGDLIAACGAGRMVSPGDRDGLADAIAALLEPEARAAARA